MKQKTTAKLKVVICTPSRVIPSKPYLASLEASIPLIVAAGYDEGFTHESGNPYISGARASMLKRGLRAQGDIFLFLDDDLSWRPEDLLKLIQTEGEVVGGTYRARDDTEENYMGRVLQDENGRITSMREDGCIECSCLPAGFLKVTKEGVDKFMKGYPELCYGPGYDQAVDLFNHGAWQGLADPRPQSQSSRMAAASPARLRAQGVRGQLPSVHAEAARRHPSPLTQGRGGQVFWQNVSGC